MPSPPTQKPGSHTQSSKAQERQQRSAAALKENLKRRKTQARSQAEAEKVKQAEQAETSQ